MIRNFHNGDGLMQLLSSGPHEPANCHCTAPHLALSPRTNSNGNHASADTVNAHVPAWEWVEAAFSDENLLTYFQPVVGTVSGRTEGYETLMRSQVNGRDGNQAGQVVDAGEQIAACQTWNVLPWMDKRARLASIRAVARAIAAEKETANLAAADGETRYFINFLPSIVDNPAVCLQTTMREAHQCGVPAHRLVFEVSESEPIQSMAHLHNVLAYYRDHGAKTAVDDLGMGWATADYLPLLRPDYLKISREWLHRAENDKQTCRELFALNKPRTTRKP